MRKNSSKSLLNYTRETVQRSSGFATFVCILTSAIVAFGASICSAKDGPELVRVATKSNEIHVGELLTQNDRSITVFDFKQDRVVEINRSSVLSEDRGISLNDAARFAGLPAVIARRIGVYFQRRKHAGKVARVGANVVYLTLNKSSGAHVNQRVAVLRGSGDIIDPDTGKVLGSAREKIAELRISEVSDGFSKARILGDVESELEIGDEVELELNQDAVAVGPFLSENGTASLAGERIAEEIFEALVNKGVATVGPAAIERSLAELQAQSTNSIDQDTLRRFGRLTGSRLLVTGTINERANSVEADLQVIDVSSSERLIAVSAPLDVKSQKHDALPSQFEFEYLGESRSLPSYMTATGYVDATANRGIRFRGFDKHEEYAAGIIRTRLRDFANRDFVFEALVTFGPNDGVAHLGLGLGRQDGQASRRAETVFVRLHSPEHGDGLVTQLGWQKQEIRLGNVRQDGVHLLRMIKRGQSLVFQVDPENDGPTDDDIETIVPELDTYAPYLNGRNSPVFLGGTATILATRAKLLTENTAAPSSRGAGSEFEYLGEPASFPKYLTTSATFQRTPENGVRIRGFSKHNDFEAGIIRTRSRDFIRRNFVFDVLVTFGPGDGVTHIGIGLGGKDGSANRRADSVFVRFHSPDHGDGAVTQLGWEKRDVSIGNVHQPGVHLLRMIKDGDSLAFQVDPENDGPTNDDFETVIPDLEGYAPYLNGKNSPLFIGGTGTIVATRLRLLPGSARQSKSTASAIPNRFEFQYLGDSLSLPGYLTTSAGFRRTPERGVRFSGHSKSDDFGDSVIQTRGRDFIDRNFVFEILCTFGSDDGAAHIGLGTGRKDGSANRRAESVFIRFHSPEQRDGQLSRLGWQKPDVAFGNVRQKGIHLVRMIKKGDTLTFQVDPGNNGKTVDDLETVISELRKFAPYLNSKNSPLFLGGTGTIVATKLKLLP